HFQSDFRSYFVTFITKDRWILPPVARDIVIKHVLFDHGRRMSLYAAVVMPEHVHVIVTPGTDATGLSFSLTAILKGIKGNSSREINRTLLQSGSLWQHK